MKKIYIKPPDVSSRFILNKKIIIYRFSGINIQHARYLVDSNVFSL